MLKGEIYMKLLAIKKDRLDELTKFGFIKRGDFYVYCESRIGFRYTIHIPIFHHPILSIGEYDEEDKEHGTVVRVPDVIMELIEAGMVERYED